MIKKIIEWFHATLIFALLIPLFFAVGELSQNGGMAALYIKCLLIAVPIVITSISSQRARTLTRYMAVCALTVMVMFFLTCVGKERNAGNTVYAVGIMSETVFIIGKRIADRLRLIRADKNYDPFAPKPVSFLDNPSLSYTWYFVIMYVLGLCFNSKGVCDIAFFSAIVYLFLALAYTFFATTNEYLNLNKRTKGIPKKRLYGVRAGMFFLYAVFIAAAIMPSVFFIGKRHYTDIRKWFDDTKAAPYDIQWESEFVPVPGGFSGMPAELDAIEAPPEPSEFWNGLFWVIAAVCAAVGIYAVVMAARQIFADFRRGLDDNGDKVEEIEDESLHKDEIMTFVRKHGDDSEAAKIRRRYKKTIRKHMKAIPAPYGTPSEIESDAGLSDDEDMHMLHALYEDVRYNRKDITK